MSACILSIVNMHDAIVKNLIPNIFNKGQIPLISKCYKRPIPKIEHMTPSLIQKKSPTSWLDRYHMPVSPTFTSAARPSHASLSPKIRLRLKVCESCSSMSIVMHFFSRFDILAFALDGCLTSAGSSDFSNFSLPSWIKFQTLFLRIVQSSIE